MSKIFNIKYTIKRMLGIPKATYLCLRFPFLYPRNRFSGLHYNNYTISRKLTDLLSCYRVFNWVRPGSKLDLYEGKKYYYTKKITSSDGYTETYWKTWWSKHLYNILNWIYKNPTQWIHCLPTYTELNAMPNGWCKAFGIQMCKELKRELIKSKCLYRYRIAQIKEKWGELCWYDAGGTTNTNKIVNKYSYISRFTCISCGELATGYTPIEYWKSPYCDNCRPKNSKYFIDFGINDRDDKEEYKSESWYGWSGNINNRSKEDYNKCIESYKEYRNISY